MIKFPPEFVATKYPGYFWNVEDKKLYSVKVTGTLKPLAKGRPGSWNNYQQAVHWKVSVNGKNRYLFLKDLEKSKLEDSTFPVYTEQLELL